MVRPRLWVDRRVGGRPVTFSKPAGKLRRFLAACGGFVDQTSNYSFGTALTLLPHILGSAQGVTGPLTSWSSIVRHTRLLVLFGGANPKNTQVAKGGCAWHGTSGWIAELARAGVRVVNVSPIRDDGPDILAPEWLTPVPRRAGMKDWAHCRHTGLRPMVRRLRAGANEIRTAGPPNALGLRLAASASHS
jgi:hypothetical protein